MNIKKRLITFTVIAVLIASPVKGQNNNQQPQSNWNQLLWLILGAGTTLIVTGSFNLIGKGNRFSVQEEISKSSIPLDKRIESVEKWMTETNVDIKYIKEAIASSEHRWKQELSNGCNRLSDRIDNDREQIEKLQQLVETTVFSLNKLSGNLEVLMRKMNKD